MIRVGINYLKIPKTYFQICVKSNASSSESHHNFDEMVSFHRPIIKKTIRDLNSDPEIWECS